MRSTLLAMLALALSSSPALAQCALASTPDVDIVSLLPIEFALEEPPIEARELTSLAEFMGMARAESAFAPITADATFKKRVESLWATGVGQTQDLFESARGRISMFVAAAKAEPRLAMHATHGALQVLDLVSTSRALGAGHREANPLFKNGNIATMAVTKSAAIGLQWLAVEHLAKNRPKAAKWVMVAANAFMSVVVVNNLAVGGQ